MAHCPNINHPTWKNMEKAFGREQAVVLYTLNNDNLLDQAPNGKDSKLYKDLLELHEGNEIEAVKSKANTFTTAFRNWFGDHLNIESKGVSKVKDVNGEPLVVYHGSKEDFNTFEKGKKDFKISNKAFFFAEDIYHARNYAKRKEIIPTFLNIKNLKKFENSSHHKTTELIAEDKIDTTKYDGIFTKDTNPSKVDDFYATYKTTTEYAVFNPNQIKSAISPTQEQKDNFKLKEDKLDKFSKEDDNIYYQKPNSFDSTTLENKIVDLKEKKLSVPSTMKKIDSIPKPMREEVEKDVESKLKRFLENVGFDYNKVKTITDSSGNPINAIAKADLVQRIIEVVQSKADITTLPEEASHVFVAIIRDTPDYNLMMNKITKFQVYNDVKEQYGADYNQNETKLREEAIGKLIANKIIDSVVDEKSNNQNMFQKIWNRIIKYLNSVLKTSKPEDIDLFLKSAKSMLAFDNNYKNFELLKVHPEEEIYFQLTNAEKNEVEKIYKAVDPKSAIIKSSYEGDYEFLAYDQKVANRTSDVVKSINQEIFERTNKKYPEDEIQVHSLSGTTLHKFKEILMNKFYKNGNTIEDLTDSKKIEAYKDAVYEQAMAELVKEDIRYDDFIKKYKKDNEGGLPFKITDSQFKELALATRFIYDSILTKTKEVNDKYGTTGPAKIITEAVLYDKNLDKASTVDLLIIYPNGYASIYDYKTSYKLSNEDEYSAYKREHFDVQINDYKYTLKTNYGVKGFYETRIIPIRATTKSKDESIYPDSYEAIEAWHPKYGDTKKYLKQIPVSQEGSTEVSLDFKMQDTKIGRSLKSLYNLRKNLLEQMKRLTNDAAKYHLIKAREERISNMIQALTVDKNVDFVITEFNAMINSYYVKKEQFGSGKVKVSNVVKDFLDLAVIYDDIALNTGDMLKKNRDIRLKETKTDEEKRNAKNYYTERKKAMNDINNQLAEFREDLLQDLITYIPNEVDIDPTQIYKGGTNNEFDRFSEYQNPFIRAFYEYNRENTSKIRDELNVVVKNINERKDVLKKWADQNGMSLYDAYEKIINPETKHLITKFTPEYIEDFKKAKKDGDFKWLDKNTKFDRKGYLEAVKKYDDTIDEVYYGDHNKAKRVGYKNKFRKTNRITGSTSGFIILNDDPKHYKSDWNYMLKNKPLKSFYDMLIAYNKHFKNLTNFNIDENFIGNVRQDTVDRMAQVGWQGIGYLAKNFYHATQVMDYDVTTRQRDENGKLIPTIPLFFIQRLKDPLSPKEIKEVLKKIKQENLDLTENDKDFQKLFKQEVSRVEYEKGNKFKSIDLTRNLILFAETVYTNATMNHAESTVNALKSIMASKGSVSEVTDGDGNKVMSRIRKVIASKLGADEKDFKAFEKYENLHLYGLIIQSKDKTFSKSRAYGEMEKLMPGLDLGEIRHSYTKTAKTVMNYVSLKNLAMRIDLGIANTVGIISNMIMNASGKLHTTNKQLREAALIRIKNNDTTKAILEYFETSSRNLIYEKANKSSGSKLTRVATMDNAFINYKLGDDFTDDVLVLALMQNYGIDPADGRIRKMSKIESKEAKSLYDQAKLTEKGELNLIKELNDKERIRFRAMIQSEATKIKGSIPQEDSMLINTSLIGAALMQHRSWMPGLIKNRFGAIRYDKDFEDFRQGRFSVMYQEIVQSKGFQNKAKTFGNLLAEILLVTPGITQVLDGNSMFAKNASKRAARHYFELFKEQNPQFKDLSLNDYLEMRKSKLREMAQELSIYLYMIGLLALARMALGDDDEDYLSRVISKNAYNAANRSLLEISFFLDPTSVGQLFKSPFAAASLFPELGYLVKSVATLDDKAPQKLTKTAPVVGQVFDVLDFWDKPVKK